MKDAFYWAIWTTLVLSVIACDRQATPSGSTQPPSPSYTVSETDQKSRAVPSASPLSTPINVEETRKALKELTVEDVEKYEEISKNGGSWTDSTRATLRLMVSLDTLTQTDALSDEELLKVERYVKRGLFAYIGARAMRKILERQGVIGWDAQAVANYFGPPTKTTADKVEYVFDDGISADHVTFWLKDGSVIKTW